MRKSISRVKLRIHRVWHHYTDNFILIHINKTGGSSIEKSLRIPFEHRTALEKIEQWGRANWDRKYTFTVVRNPWDKVVSEYYHRVGSYQNDLRNNPIDFKEWVKRVYSKQDPFYYDKPKMFMPQMDWITDKEGNILVDKIIRFENLGAEFGEVCGIIGRNADLPHVKASKRGQYRDYYDEETYRLIEHWFKRDIEMFGY